MTHPAGKCPICHIAFKDKDDIVTCPSCGAPYHRECYMKQGHCSFESQHGPGFEYVSPDAPPPEPESREQIRSAPEYKSGGVLCSHCQTVNDAQNIFCENCGHPLHAAAPTEPQFIPFMSMGGMNPAAAMQNQTQAYVNEAPEKTIFGIQTKDWARFVGKNALYYLPRLESQERQQNKMGFILSAAIYSPVYFAYRKMWIWTLVSLALNMLLVVPQILFIADWGGLALPAFLSQGNISTLLTVATYISLLSRLGFGLFALYLYRQHSIKKITDLRSQHGDDLQFGAALDKQGGVSVLGVVLVLAVVFISYLVLYSYMGDVLVAFFYPGLKI